MLILTRDQLNLISNLILMKRVLFIILGLLERKDFGRIHMYLDKFRHSAHQLDQENRRILLVELWQIAEQEMSLSHTLVLILEKEDNYFQHVIQWEIET